MGFPAAWDDEFRAFVDELCRFETTAGNEAPAQAWLSDVLESAGFETYRWEADADVLASHPSFRTIPTPSRRRADRASRASSSSATPTPGGRWC